MFCNFLIPYVKEGESCFRSLFWGGRSIKNYNYFSWHDGQVKILNGCTGLIPDSNDIKFSSLNNFDKISFPDYIHSTAFIHPKLQWVFG